MVPKKNINLTLNCLVEDGVIDNLLKILAGYLKLSPKEKGVLKWLLKLKWQGVDEIDTEVRRYIQTQMAISQFSFNNYIKSLKARGLLKYTESGKLQLSSILSGLDCEAGKPFSIDIKFTLNFSPNPNDFPSK